MKVAKRKPEKPKKEGEAKDLRGRPNKLTANLIEALDGIIEKWNPFAIKTGKKVVEEFFSLSTLDNLAFKMGISSRALYYFQKEESDLGALFLQSIKKYETKRNAFFMMLLPYFKRDSIWIFLAKNFLGFKDVNQIELGGIPGQPIEFEEIKKRILEIDVDRIVEMVKRAQHRLAADTKNSSQFKAKG